MIIDSLANGSRYENLHPLFAKAFTYLRSTDFSGMPDGKMSIEVGLNVILSEGKGKTAEESHKKFECHDKYIDIQLCLSGKETMGWKDRIACSQPNGEYNLEKDVRYFHDAADTYFQLTDGQFAIFFPEDVHAPMIGEGVIRKSVVKVKM